MEDKTLKQNPISENNLQKLATFSKKLAEAFLVQIAYFGVNKTKFECLTKGGFKTKDEFIKTLIENTQPKAVFGRGFHALIPSIEDLEKKYETSQKNLNKKEIQLEFINDLMINDYIKIPYLPDNYSNPHYRMDAEYPSSPIGISQNWPGNQINHLSLTPGLFVGDKKRSLASDFFKFLLEKKPDILLPLGTFGRDFEDYAKPGLYGKDFEFKVSAEPIENKNGLVIGKKLLITNLTNNTSHTLTLYNIKISDNATLSLDYATNQLLLDLIGSKKVIMIHCSAGVGRTGTLAAAISIFKNEEANNILTKIANSLLENKDIDQTDLDKLFELSIEVISKLRKIRPAISTRNQLEGLLYNLISLKLSTLCNEETFNNIISQFPLPPKTPLHIQNKEEASQELKQFQEKFKIMEKLVERNMCVFSILNNLKSKPLYGGKPAQMLNTAVSFIESTLIKSSQPGFHNMNRKDDLEKLYNDFKSGEITDIETYDQRFLKIYQDTRSSSMGVLHSLMTPYYEKYCSQNFKEEDKVSHP